MINAELSGNPEMGIRTEGSIYKYLNHISLNQKAKLVMSVISDSQGQRVVDEITLPRGRIAL